MESVESKEIKEIDELHSENFDDTILTETIDKCKTPKFNAPKTIIDARTKETIKDTSKDNVKDTIKDTSKDSKCITHINRELSFTGNKYYLTDLYTTSLIDNKEDAIKKYMGYYDSMHAFSLACEMVYKKSLEGLCSHVISTNVIQNNKKKQIKIIFRENVLTLIKDLENKLNRSITCNNLILLCYAFLCSQGNPLHSILTLKNIKIVNIWHIVPFLYHKPKIIVRINGKIFKDLHAVEDDRLVSEDAE